MVFPDSQFNVVDRYSLSSAPFFKLIHAFFVVMCLEAIILAFFVCKNSFNNLICFVHVYYFVSARYKSLALFKLRSHTPRVRLVPQGEESSGLTSGFLFPGPASGEEASVLAQFF